RQGRILSRVHETWAKSAGEGGLLLDAAVDGGDPAEGEVERDVAKPGPLHHRLQLFRLRPAGHRIGKILVSIDLRAGDHPTDAREDVAEVHQVALAQQGV